ncbi:hypothetical protein [Myxococcus sp. RHSTA-1-4]|uniref:hypothetical protein n=1 Tax=Myxococcus sp. RHSTA-1-4 TaxID=2874601 RepID=UPI001CBECFBC|nr:hypothetical protein [Myxococcus sp. RHSTA-1-4]MBZ4415753.1 hypothetical protein [Myxococcus sp. RHSTA-1-4]
MAPAAEPGPPTPEPPSPATAPPPSLEARLQQRLSQPLDAGLQQELARLLHLRVAGASVLEPAALENLQVALHALLADEPNLHLARDLRRRLESRLADRLHPLRLGAILRTDSPSIQVMLGLMGALVLIVALGLAGELLRSRMEGFKLFGHIDFHLMLASLLTGKLGAVTSLLVRIRGFEQPDTAAPASRVMQGFSRPLVGAAFAVFGLLVFKSQLLPIKLPTGTPMEEYSFFLAMSFMLGFSERLGQDMAAQLEARLDSGGKDVHTSPPSPVSSGSGEPAKS